MGLSHSKTGFDMVTDNLSDPLSKLRGQTPTQLLKDCITELASKYVTEPATGPVLMSIILPVVIEDSAMKIMSLVL